MISVQEARHIILQNIIPLAPVRLPLQQAAGRILAGDLFAKTDIPAFPQSSMDGYAFSYQGWQAHKKLRVQGEQAAGSAEDLPLDPAQAVRIFTGAAVPSGADTVLMQEKAMVRNGELEVGDINLQPGSNVRLRGSEIREGDLALNANHLLSPASIGFLAGVGITEVSVYPLPAVCLIVTGKELQQPGMPLQYGQVYDSNSYTLTAALRQAGIESVNVQWCDDDPAMLTDKLQEALLTHDLVMLTGGVSAGDYDFVPGAAENCGVTQLFHKVKQRPGKPLFAGKKETKLVIGLPGNPASVLTCFYQYVRPALGAFSKLDLTLPVKQVPIGREFQKAAGLTHFLKGWYDGRLVIPLDAQESFRLSSFARANCLIEIGEDVISCREGEPVTIHILP